MALPRRVRRLRCRIPRRVGIQGLELVRVQAPLRFGPFERVMCTPASEVLVVNHYVSLLDNLERGFIFIQAWKVQTRFARYDSSVPSTAPRPYEYGLLCFKEIIY